MSRSNINYDEAVLKSARLIVENPSIRKGVVVNVIAAMFDETAGCVQFDISVELRCLRKGI